MEIMELECRMERMKKTKILMILPRADLRHLLDDYLWDLPHLFFWNLKLLFFIDTRLQSSLAITIAPSGSELLTMRLPTVVNIYDNNSINF